MRVSFNDLLLLCFCTDELLLITVLACFKVTKEAIPADNDKVLSSVFCTLFLSSLSHELHLLTVVFVFGLGGVSLSDNAGCDGSEVLFVCFEVLSVALKTTGGESDVDTLGLLELQQL